MPYDDGCGMYAGNIDLKEKGMRSMKHGIILVFALSILSADAYADMKLTLYGFKIGQHLSAMKKDLGSPHMTHKYDDGYVAYIYQFKGHNVIFEADNTRPDIIFSIQIEGKTNPEGYGLDSINLGDGMDKAVKIFGKADSVKKALDAITKKEMSDTAYHDYYNAGNFSLETVSNVITSMKITYNGINKADAVPSGAFDSFLKAVKNKNYYDIAKYLTAASTVYWNGEYKIDTSVFTFLQKNKHINDVFFNRQSGIASFEKSDVAETSMRVMNDGTSGFVYKIKKNKIDYEIFFIESFEGWVVSYIDKLN